jgi:predicted DNA-binding transcriptional regulator YafY
MSDTPARLLNLLSLLQMPRTWSGEELARRLRISRRTVRRDMERLRDLGYPVRTAMGAGGGYRLAAGSAMPPLLLDDEEAVAIAVGLRAAAANAIQGMEGRTFRVDRITEPFLTGQRFAARLPEGTDQAQFARDRVYSTAPVVRAVVTVHRPDPPARERLAGWEAAADGRLISPPDTVPWLASVLLGLGCEFEVHAPPELIDHLTEMAGRALRAAGPASPDA